MVKAARVVAIAPRAELEAERRAPVARQVLDRVVGRAPAIARRLWLTIALSTAYTAVVYWWSPEHPTGSAGWMNVFGVVNGVALGALVGFRTKIATMLSWITTFLGRGRGQLTITEQQAYARTTIEQLQATVEDEKAAS